eukprot:CAMPEP_0170519300 /NCGR_PEP_ID=MMETSP0209-20121228/4773_1 /TAXON_ID=665100 ORGANISM="Litonotus pictus, Strain P1" /NCGR_SAMPLE_ID=MMETSP0209 /ASSEMBLY_ACC=CAM_ASM_000301 /LENGTH=338 /DNA_ID=CAMNT_0010805159 /DNA_START=1376 /DNA_END=2392 /DNA_ORIENTATION=+
MLKSIKNSDKKYSDESYEDSDTFKKKTSDISIAKEIYKNYKEKSNSHYSKSNDNDNNFEETYTEILESDRNDSEIKNDFIISSDYENQDTIYRTAEADVADYFFQKDCKRMLELRRNYVYKLISSKMWTSSKCSTIHNCIIVYDWDDTLFYTTFLGQNNLIIDLYVNNMPESTNSIFKQIENIVYEILVKSLEKGDTYIISNSSKGWVEFSCGKYFPNIVPLLQKINVISSRHLYETEYPKDYKRWKVEAFKDLLKKYNTYLVSNIISIGDSTYEIEAAHVLGGYFREAYVKTIKFKNSPTPKEMFKQLTMLKSRFVDVYSLIKNLNMKVEKKEKSEA